jgi:hypothetical protein
MEQLPARDGQKNGPESGRDLSEGERIETLPWDS